MTCPRCDHRKPQEVRNLRRREDPALPLRTRSKGASTRSRNTSARTSISRSSSRTTLQHGPIVPIDFGPHHASSPQHRHLSWAVRRSRGSARRILNARTSPSGCSSGALRVTNGFSKKLTNLKAAVAVFVAWYNFCRVHSTLRVTPAMEAGLTNHVWTIGELLTAETGLESAA